MNIPKKAVLTGAAIGAVIAAGAIGVPAAVEAVKSRQEESQGMVAALYGPSTIRGNPFNYEYEEYGNNYVEADIS